MPNPLGTLPEAIDKISICNKPIIDDESESDYNIYDLLKKQRSKNPRNIIIAHLNINSIRNKFVYLEEMVNGLIDIFLISESKIDSSFTNKQFAIGGYKMFRLDRNGNGGGLLLYVHEDIPGKMITTFTFAKDLEILVIEFTISKKKWLLYGIYKPPNVSNTYFLEEIQNSLNFFYSHYENIILVGDFNMTAEDICMKQFLESFDMQNLINEPTCFKSSNPRCIDLIITNRKADFLSQSVFETGISDHQKLTTAILRKHFVRGRPKTILYRDYK